MKSLLFSSVILGALLLACGDKTPAKSPDSTSGITETSAKEDMPPEPAKSAAPATSEAPSSKPAEGPGAAGGMMKVVAMKVTPAKKGKAVEVKDDGTVMVDGKAVAKIKGDQVDSTGGTSMLTVGVDGSLVGNGVKPGFKFEGDDIVTENGTKFSVADDGAVTMTTKDGKSEPIAKSTGGGSAKRATLVVVALWMTIPAAATKK